MKHLPNDFNKLLRRPVESAARSGHSNHGGKLKRFTLDCESIQADGDFWDLYCEVVRPEGEGYFGRNLDAFWDAVSAGGPGWPGECQIELVNASGFARKNPRLFRGLQRIARELGTNANVKIVVPELL